MESEQPSDFPEEQPTEQPTEEPAEQGTERQAERQAVRYHQIAISDKELRSGETSYDTIQSGVNEFHKNGFVILQNAISLETIDKYRTKLQADALQKLDDPDLIYNSGNNSNTNFSFSPPLSKEWLIEDIWANKHAAAIMEAIFGLPQLAYANTTVDLQSTDRQAVHCDAYGTLGSFPLCIEVSIYLDDVSAETGGPELWPGSHKGWTVKDQLPHGRGWIKSSAFSRRARFAPPVQPEIPKGSVILRDLRTWHAGMGNLNELEELRIQLGFFYFPRWFRSPMRLTLPSDCKKEVQSWKGVDALGAVEFVDLKKGEELNHLDVERCMVGQLNFSQDPGKNVRRVWEECDVKEGRGELDYLEVTEANYWVPGKEENPEKGGKNRNRDKGKGKGKGNKPAGSGVEGRKDNDRGKGKGNRNNDRPFKAQGGGVKKNKKGPRRNDEEDRGHRQKNNKINRREENAFSKPE
ncbi:phytanoyl- dioxygenase family protein [Rutstroemia sp. NJR-2017a BBW]|nr:phytanoyl- dioxygenase family protein [Rutstroemia sp. NJR-2017a BBW]